MNAFKRNVLVIGAYGLIGHGISIRLIGDGFGVVGLGRDIEAAQRVLPDAARIEHDIRALCDEAAWRAIVSDFAVVVNCLGALQDGPDDDLEAIHHHAVAALATACAARNVALIQISAVGASPDASTRFLASKGRGDAAIRASGGRWQIFRPGLVLASNAYGGTAMLRMLAAFPCIQPIAAPEAKIRTVALHDVANAVAAAVQGRFPPGFEADLVEAEAHSLRDIIAQMRHWLGFRPARSEIVLPGFGVVAVARLADALARLGWRSPLRSTALAVLTDGVRGRPADLGKFGVPPVSTLDQTLASIPVGVQDRLFDAWPCSHRSSWRAYACFG